MMARQMLTTHLDGSHTFITLTEQGNLRFEWNSNGKLTNCASESPLDKEGVDFFFDEVVSSFVINDKDFEAKREILEKDYYSTSLSYSYTRKKKHPDSFFGKLPLGATVESCKVLFAENLARYNEESFLVPTSQSHRARERGEQHMDHRRYSNSTEDQLRRRLDIGYSLAEAYQNCTYATGKLCIRRRKQQ